MTVTDTAVLSTAPVTFASYGHTVSLATLIVSWAIHADIYRNRYIRHFCPEALESPTCISNRDVIDRFSSVCLHERDLMRQVLRKLLFNWIISQLWERLLTKCRPDESLPARLLLLLTMTITAEVLMPCSLPNSGKLRHRLLPLTIRLYLRRPASLTTAQPGTAEAFWSTRKLLIPGLLVLRAFREFPTTPVLYATLRTSELVLALVN